MPAVGGRTPANAAQDEEGRVLLGVLLKEYEGHQSRGGNGRGVQGLVNVPAIVWMRRALGLAVGAEFFEALETLERSASTRGDAY